MREPTAKQQHVLDLISQSVRERGYPPTLRELAASLGIRPASAHAHLVLLERKGLLERGRGARALRVVARDRQRRRR